MVHEMPQEISLWCLVDFQWHTCNILQSHLVGSIQSIWQGFVWYIMVQKSETLQKLPGRSQDLSVAELNQSQQTCPLGTCLESIPAMLSHLGFHHSTAGLAVSHLSNEFQWYDITTKACETLRQGTTYVTVRAWPRWQFEPSLQLPQWSHCKAGPPGSVAWQGHVAQDGPSDWIHHEHHWYHQ